MDFNFTKFGQSQILAPARAPSLTIDSKGNMNAGKLQDVKNSSHYLYMKGKKKIKSLMRFAQPYISRLRDKASVLSHTFTQKFSEDHVFRARFISGMSLVFIGLFISSSSINLPSTVLEIISPISNRLEPLTNEKRSKEVFGFAPYWTFNKLDNVDFSTLTTLAYFGIEVASDGSLVTDDPGYTTYNSERATELFEKAHSHGTRVVLTITNMDNDSIEAIMDSPEAQERAIRQTVALVQEKGIDGINLDFEYVGDPGSEYRNKFTAFSKNLTDAMHAKNPKSRVTVSVYASAVKDPKIYDIGAVAANTDGIFMMAYDFAVAGSDHAIPTAPLYGHKEGKYWYDVSTAVDDFLTQMPAEKLILGLPWYGYNYPVSQPGVKVARSRGYYATAYNRWGYRYSYFVPLRAHAQTYKIATLDKPAELTGWDEYGKVGWRAYREDGVWRMIFVEDTKSLSYKYDFALQKDLGGVGIWALGFDEGTHEMWNLLSSKFGKRYATNIK